MKIHHKIKKVAHKSRLIIIENWAVLLGLFVTFSGITLSNMIPNIWNSFNFVKREKAKEQIESVQIYANMDYIEDSLGIPIVKYNFSYYEPEIYDSYKESYVPGKRVIGTKAVYNTDYYLMILYYSDDRTLMGYVLSLKDKKCNPKILGNLLDFFYALNDPESLEQSEKILVFDQISSRNDTATYYLESHYHHLSTYGLFVGTGYLDLVEEDKNSTYRNQWMDELQKYVKKCINIFDTENLILDGSEIDNIDTAKELTASIHKLKPNTISIFDEADMNVVSFFKSEFSHDLGICEQDYLLIDY